MLIVLQVAFLTLIASALEPLSSQPQLQCSACLAVAELVGQKMNDTAKLKTTFQASHRLDARNKVKRIDYESSELRAYEILDGLCNELEKEYVFRLGENNLRLFSSNKSLSRANFYGKNDKKELRGVSKRLKDICNEITEEDDTKIISLIKKERQLDSLQQQLCYSEGFKCCGTKKVEASKEKERDRREKWLSFKKIKDEKAKAREEREKRKKERESEDKKKLDEATLAEASVKSSHDSTLEEQPQQEL
jgi:hypothetical protein